MAILKAGGIGIGGGGGLHFRDPPDVFANEAARTAAFSAGGAVAGEHTQFAADRSLAIIIGTIAAPMMFMTYTGDAGAYDDGAWLDRTDAVQGRRGAQGAQGVYRVAVFRNAAATPPAPVGGSVAADGALAVPADWTAAATIPPDGESTYRSEAVINALGASFPIVPVWLAPFELPVYAAASAAEDSADDAAASAAAAARAHALAVGSPRGDLWATSPVLNTDNRGEGELVPFDVNRWTVSAEGDAAGVTAAATDEEFLQLPDLPPVGVIGIWVTAEVDGVETGATYLPWGAVTTNRGDFPLLAKAFAGVDGSNDRQYVNFDRRPTGLARLYGGGTTLSANTVVRVYAAVVRGAPGAGGMGAGLTVAQVQALIDATPLSNLAGQVTDGQVPDSFTRDVEIRADALIAILTGNIQFSDIAGMIADGQVPASFMRDAELTLARIATALGTTPAAVNRILIGQPTRSGNELTFTLLDGSTETVPLPAGMGGVADGRFRFGTVAPADSLGNDGDAYLFVNVGAGTATFYERVAGAWIERATVDLTATGGDHTRRGAISADMILESAEVLAGTSSTSSDIAMPMWGIGVARIRFVGVPEDEADITDLQQGGLSVFLGWSRYEDNDGNAIIIEGHKWWSDGLAVDGEFNSGQMFTIIQG